VIFTHLITDDSELFVCGSFWPGAKDGAPMPDWFLAGGPPVKDKRTNRQYPCWHCHHQHQTGETCGHDDAPKDRAARVCECDR